MVQEIDLGDEDTEDGEFDDEEEDTESDEEEEDEVGRVDYLQGFCRLQGADVCLPYRTATCKSLPVPCAACCAA